MSEFIPMCSIEEYTNEYESAADRIWHLVLDEPEQAKALCGEEPESGWAGMGLVATCPKCLAELERLPQASRRPAERPSQAGRQDRPDNAKASQRGPERPEKG